MSDDMWVDDVADVTSTQDTAAAVSGSDDTAAVDGGRAGKRGKGGRSRKADTDDTTAAGTKTTRTGATRGRPRKTTTHQHDAATVRTVLETRDRIHDADPQVRAQAAHLMGVDDDVTALTVAALTKPSSRRDVDEVRRIRDGAVASEVDQLVDTILILDSDPGAGRRIASTLRVIDPSIDVNTEARTPNAQIARSIVQKTATLTDDQLQTVDAAITLLGH